MPSLLQQARAHEYGSRPATMQLLLRQGRWPAGLSLGLLLVALLLLGTEPGRR
ncbi:hypothetical protein NMB32_02700 [Stenotrophomonas sp. CD2]|nr:hypothetical protein NMB32_02700 [Stenotrophomonas sp. CD2]